MGDYHDPYLKTDFLLLIDFFEKFIDICLQYYVLDPCHYFSSLGVSWNAMVKMTEIEFELISDIAMYLSIERGMRGGVSYIAKRHSKEDHKHMQWYDVNEPSNF